MVTIYSDNGKEECTIVTIYQQKKSEYEIYKYKIYINMKYIWGPHGKQYGHPTLVTQKFAKKKCTH